MKVHLKNFGQGHIVTSKETHHLKKALKTQDIKITKVPERADVIIVKAFSHTWDKIKEYNKPVVLHSYGIQWSKELNLKEVNKDYHEIWQKADGVVHMSEFAKNLSHHYINNYTDIGKIDRPESVIFNAQRILWRLDGNSPEDTFKCATTSIWRGWKRLDEVIRLIRAWNEKNTPKIELYVGGNVENEVKDEYIHYLGFVHDINYYDMLDASIHLALMETFGNTVAEAIAYGLPVITTNFGAASELVQDSGMVLDNDPEELIKFQERPNMHGQPPKIKDELFMKGMRELIDNYTKYRRRTIKRSLDFNYKVIGKQWANHLTKIMKG